MVACFVSQPLKTMFNTYGNNSKTRKRQALHPILVLLCRSDVCDNESRVYYNYLGCFVNKIKKEEENLLAFER